jgi:CRP-like cAMP-binding protein
VTSVTVSQDADRGNLVLAALPDDVYAQCRRELEPVQLRMRQLLSARDEPIRDVWFPLGAVASLIIPLGDGSAVEAATVGNEGVVGLPVFLGAASQPMDVFAQVPGPALRMSAEAFRELLADADGPLARVLQRYTQTLFIQLAQNVACNRLHTVEQRCARWLLMTADRVPPGPLPLTQEFLAQMLGVRRASITEVAGRLASHGAITYTRGVVTVTDRAGLEQVSCECYPVIASTLRRMLADPDAATTVPSNQPQDKARPR